MRGGAWGSTYMAKFVVHQEVLRRVGHFIVLPGYELMEVMSTGHPKKPHSIALA